MHVFSCTETEEKLSESCVVANKSTSDYPSKEQKKKKKEEMKYSFIHPSASTIKICPTTMKISTIRNRLFLFPETHFQIER